MNKESKNDKAAEKLPEKTDQNIDPSKTNVISDENVVKKEINYEKTKSKEIQVIVATHTMTTRKRKSTLEKPKEIEEPKEEETSKEPSPDDVKKNSKRVDHCVVYHCTNNSYNHPYFYSFPRRKGRKVNMKWYNLCTQEHPYDKLPKIPEDKPGQEYFTHLRVCSDHFKPEDLERNLRNELLGLPCKPKLKLDAVPCLNLTKTKAKTKKEKVAEMEKAVKERKEMIQEILKNHEDEKKMEKIHQITNNKDKQNQMVEVYASLGKTILSSSSLQNSNPKVQSSQNIVPNLIKNSTPTLMDKLRAEEKKVEALVYEQTRVADIEKSIPSYEKKLEEETKWLESFKEDNKKLEEKDDNLKPVRNPDGSLRDHKWFTQVCETQTKKIDDIKSRMDFLKEEKNRLETYSLSSKKVETVEDYLRNKVIEIAQSKITLDRQLRDAKAESARWRAKFNTLKKHNEKLRYNKQKKVVSMKDVKEKLKCICSKSMINFIFGTRPGSGEFHVRNWERKEIINSLLLRYISSKAYNFLRAKKMMPLPSNKTMVRWLPELNMERMCDIKTLRDSEEKAIQYWIPNPDRVEFLKLRKVEKIETLKFQREELQEEKRRVKRVPSSKKGSVKFKKISNTEVMARKKLNQAKKRKIITNDGIAGPSTAKRSNPTLETYENVYQLRDYSTNIGYGETVESTETNAAIDSILYDSEFGVKSDTRNQTEHEYIPMTDTDENTFVIQSNPVADTSHEIHQSTATTANHIRIINEPTIGAPVSTSHQQVSQNVLINPNITPAISYVQSDAAVPTIQLAPATQTAESTGISFTNQAQPQTQNRPNYQIKVVYPTETHEAPPPQTNVKKTYIIKRSEFLKMCNKQNPIEVEKKTPIPKDPNEGKPVIPVMLNGILQNVVLKKK